MVVVVPLGVAFLVMLTWDVVFVCVPVVVIVACRFDCGFAAGAALIVAEFVIAKTADTDRANSIALIRLEQSVLFDGVI